jgi:YidC/Oxa1 family membrane protein insertase
LRVALAAVSSIHPLCEPLEVRVMFSFFFTLFDGAVRVAYHLVSGFAVALNPLAGGLAAAAAIAAFTVAVRLVLLPLSYYAIRGQAAQARLAPQVAALRQRHARQPERLQRELTELYRREGTGMFAGYLPMLLQLPFFAVMYRLFRLGTIGGQPNALLSHRLLGAPLGSHWLSGPGPLSGQGMVYLGLFALLAVVTWVAARISRNAAARQAAQAPASGRPGTAQPGSGQPGGAIGMLLRVIPYATVVIAAVVPLAAGLYLLTTTAWAAAERAVITRRIPPGRPTPGQPGGRPTPGQPAGRPGPGQPAGRPAPGRRKVRPQSGSA